MRIHFPQNEWAKRTILSILVSVSAIAHADVIELEPFWTGSLQNDNGTVAQSLWIISGWESPASEPTQRGHYFFEVPASTGTIVSAEWQFVQISAKVGFFGFSFYDLYDVASGGGSKPDGGQL